MFTRWSQEPLVRYLSLYRRRWPMVTCCVVLALLVNALVMPIPLIFGRLVDDYIPRKDGQGILIMAGLATVLYLLNLGLGLTQRYLTLKTTKAVIFELRARVCTKLQELCLSFYENNNIGRLHARAMIDTEQVDVASNTMVTQLLVSTAGFIIALVILIRLNPLLTLVLLIVLPLSYLIVRNTRVQLRQSQRDFRDQRETLSSNIHDLLNSIRLVKTFGMEPLEEEKLNENIREYLRRGIRSATIGSFFSYLIMLVGNLSTLVVWVVGAILAVKGKMTIGQIVAFAGFQGFLLNPINQLAMMTETLMSGSTALGKIFDLLDNGEVEFPADGEAVEQIRGEVAFHNVDFTYTDGTKALDGVTVAVEPGKQIALVGESGAGKSTLIHLILGLYLPTTGQVKIDGKDITTLNLRSLRRQIGMVSQETILVSGNVRDNIRYGTPEATDADVVSAAQRANAHEFIMRLPDGYDASIGEEGVKLSGGQRQRLAIARALLRDPRILILDEATSALDSESELQVQQALEVLRCNRTTFVIAHRLSTILNSDAILVMKAGRIVERGTHEELLARRGEYAHLYHTQFHRALNLPSPKMASGAKESPSMTALK